MVSEDSRVKLLDFGLAKAFEADPSSPDVSHSPTLTARGTAAGMILGTAAYMSPEQARGKPVDKRSDIWAFGVVLYEMLTGKRLFRGETVSDTLAAVLREPVDWTQLPASTPRNVHSLLERCLERDPKERLRDIGEARVALEHPSAAGVVAKSGLDSASRSKGRWLPWAIAALAVGVAAFTLLRTKGTGLLSPAPPRVFQQLTYQPGWELYPSLSPDGASFVYVSGAEGRPDIYLQRVGGQNATNLTKDFPAESSAPAFSPSGASIAFRSERDGGGIFLMGATGENVRRLTDFGFNPAWSPDGSHLALSSQTFSGHPFFRKGYADLWTVDVTSGKKELVLKGELRAHGREGDAMQPSWSPHGHRIAYWGLRGQTGRRNIWTIPAEGGPTVSVTDGPATDWNPIWSPDGKYLYFGSDRSGSLNLWRVAIDEKSGKTLADPEPVTLPTTWAGLFTLSRDGKHLAYSTREVRGTISRVAFDPATQSVSGGRTTILDTSIAMVDLRVSPDGRRLAFRRSGGSHEEIHLLKTDGTGLRRLTEDSYRNRGPSFAPDGKRLAFYSNRSGQYELWTINLDGSGLTQITENVGSGPEYPYWSPDGSRLAFHDGHTSYILNMLQPPLTQKPEKLPELPHGDSFLVFGWSPDGQFLVGGRQGEATVNLGIFTYEVATGTYRQETETGGGSIRPLSQFGTGNVAAFLPDGRHIIYLDNSILRVVDLATKKTRAVAPKSVLGPLLDFAISEDGRSLYFVEGNEEADIWMATIEGAGTREQD